MHTKESELIIIKKLKKDGSINDEAIKSVSDCILRGEVAILPVDNIYAAVGIVSPKTEEKMIRILKIHKKKFGRLISSFKMLVDLAVYSKTDYDFLNRIWPGEIMVILKKKDYISTKDTIAIRFPRSKYMQSIIGNVDAPLIFSNLYSGITKSPQYKKNNIINIYKDRADLILIIDELCRSHPLTSLIDISESKLNILRGGKVSADEIKSLYFLGRDSSIDS